MVLCANAGARVLRRLRAAGSVAPLALDEQRYLEPSSPGSLQLIDESRLAAENQAVLRTSVYLAPSQRVGGTLASLQEVLDAGERFLEAVGDQAHAAPGYVPIVVGPQWRRAMLDDMCAELSMRRLPIAFLFASTHDPLSTAGDVAAAITLISAVTDSIVLRCDLSAIGLVAHGARWGAIGASSDMRHVFIPMSRKAVDSRRSDRSAHVFVPSLRAWLRGSKLTFIDGPEDLFCCDCRLCGGRSVLRFRESGPLDDLVRAEADAHAALAWRLIAARVLDDNVADPRRSWQEECASGLRSYSILSEHGVELKPPSYLGAWSSIS